MLLFIAFIDELSLLLITTLIITDIISAIIVA